MAANMAAAAMVGCRLLPLLCMSIQRVHRAGVAKRLRQQGMSAHTAPRARVKVRLAKLSQRTKQVLFCSQRQVVAVAVAK